MPLRFIHNVAYINDQFLFIVEYHFTEWIHYGFFIHSLLKCMWAISSLGQLWIMNMNSDINIHVQMFYENVSFCLKISMSYGKHMFNFIRTWWATSQHGLTIFRSYQDSMWNFQLLHIIVSTWYCQWYFF